MRYRVLDLPAKGTGAFTPLPARNPVASSFGLVQVVGSPGGLPSPVMSPSEQWGAPRMSANPDAMQPSMVAPNVIMPGKYIAYATNMGPSADAGIGMAMRRRNPLPVPALSWLNSVRSAMSSYRIGGRAALPWPRAFQRFPTVGGKMPSNGGG